MSDMTTETHGLLCDGACPDFQYWDEEWSIWIHRGPRTVPTSRNATGRAPAGAGRETCRLSYPHATIGITNRPEPTATHQHPEEGHGGELPAWTS